MALPTSGYNPQNVKYLIGSNAGVSLSIDGSAEDVAAELEELLTYLDSALVSFKSAYDSGTSYTVNIYKSFQGETTPAAP